MIRQVEDQTHLYEVVEIESIVACGIGSSPLFAEYKTAKVT